MPVRTRLTSSTATRGEVRSPDPIFLRCYRHPFRRVALTTIQEKMPGRPIVEPYLHGVPELELPETQVAWREEVCVITGGLLNIHNPKDLLADYPLKPHELLRDRSDRVFKHLAAIAERYPDRPVWLLDNEGNVEPLVLRELADRDKKDRIHHRTVLLPPDVGGLRAGLLDGSSLPSANRTEDVADEWYEDLEQTKPAPDTCMGRWGSPEKYAAYSCRHRHQAKYGRREFGRAVARQTILVVVCSASIGRRRWLKDKSFRHYFGPPHT